MNKRFNTPPPPKPKEYQQTRTLHDSLVSGFGLGIGNSIAKKLMNGLFASSIVERQIVINPPNDSRTCDYLITELDSCILLNKDCNDLYKKLKLHECQYEQYECQKPKIIYDKSFI